MLRILIWAAQGLMLALIVYDLIVALWGWPGPAQAPYGKRTRRFRVVVPAHNEEAVIEGVLRDLAAQNYPQDLVATWVIADRCDDETAAVAARWARVEERREGSGSKGAALAWHLERHPLEEEEALVILDADSRVPPELLGRFADEMGSGRRALQAYLDIDNPDASLLTTASALSYWAGNRMVQLARSRLGWSADLGGTGMCFASEALEAAGGIGDSLTEDRDLALRMALGGVPVTWLHDVRIRDPKPLGAGAAVRQRARWVAGKHSMIRLYVMRLISGAARRGSAALFDQAVRLLHPGRSFLALVSALLALLAWATGSSLLLPWGVWALAAGIQFLAPLVFLARDGVPGHYLARYPLLTLLAVLWVPIRILSLRAARGWYHTPRNAARAVDGEG